MIEKGVARDVITYNTLIQAFCKKEKLLMVQSYLKKWRSMGSLPSTFSYTPLIEKLCEAGDMQEVKCLWNNMCKRGLVPLVCSHEYAIIRLCEQGCRGEAMAKGMLKSNLKPRKETSKRLLHFLPQDDFWDDS